MKNNIAPSAWRPAPSKKVGTQNETRENIDMLTNNDQTKAQFPLSLDGRGVRGEGAVALAATVATIAALLLAPPAALADNECGLTDGLPGTADTATCDPADYDSGYPDGITYSSDGDFTLEIPDGSDQLNVFDDGISVTGNLGDNLSLDASAFTDRIVGMGGAIIDYSSGTGNIDIDAPSGDGFTSIRGEGLATHGILATSSGGGNIDIFSPGRIAGDLTGPDFTAIEVNTNGGDINIVALRNVNSNSLNPGTIRNGIIAETSDAGTITIDVPAAETGARGIDVLTKAIYAVTGTGDINITGGANLRFNPRAIGIHAVTSGAINLNVSGIFSSNEAGNNPSRIGILTENSQLLTVNLAGHIDGVETAIRSSGGSAVINILDRGPEDFDDLTGIHAALDFSGLAGSAEVHFGTNTSWVADDAWTHLFSAGDDLVTTTSSTVVRQSISTFASSAIDAPAIVDFGNGSDIFNNMGVLVVAPGEVDNDTERTSNEGEFRVENLEAFNNSGTIYLGGRVQVGDLSGTDGHYDDILAMPGVDFVGSGDSRIELDIFLNEVGNPSGSCSAAARNADGDLPAADCINLSGGTASGRTEIVFNTLIPGDRGALSPDGTVIVDLAGGSADPDAFFMSPESDFYSPQFGGVMDKGLFFYPLAYDADAQQFKLFGQPSSAAQQVTIMGNVANDLWRTTTDGWFGRQVDQRDIGLTDNGGGVWIRFAASAAERDVTTPIVAGVETFEFDNSYTQDDSSMTVGRDFIFRGDGDRAWLAGAMIGYDRARVDFDAHPNSANLEGIHFGVYGSVTMGDFFLDAAVNGNWVDMDYDAPVLDLFPEGTVLSTDVVSLGGQVEAGWRGLKLWRVGIEPLANLSYVVSDFEDVFVPAADPTRGGGNFEFDDPKSFRAGLGVRLSVDDVLPGFAPTHLGLTTRVLNESEGESTATITSTGPIPVDQTDTLDGTFTEVTGSVSITNTAKTAAGYLNVNGTFGDDYDSSGIEAGFRYQW